MTDKELNDMVYSDNPWERRTAAMNGYGLDILVHDRYYLPCSGKTLRAVKEATER